MLIVYIFFVKIHDILIRKLQTAWLIKENKVQLIIIWLIID